MREFAIGLLSGIMLTLGVEFVLYVVGMCLWRAARCPDDLESMKRHLDELYDDIGRGKMP